METSIEDERRKWIVPTAKVRRIWQQTGKQLEEIQACMCRGISCSDREILERSLEKMLGNIREENRRRIHV